MRGGGRRAGEGWRQTHAEVDKYIPPVGSGLQRWHVFREIVSVCVCVCVLVCTHRLSSTDPWSTALTQTGNLRKTDKDGQLCENDST